MHGYCNSLGSWRYPSIFQMKDHNARHCVIKSGSLQDAPESVLYESFVGKAQASIKMPGCWNARDLECLPKKISGNECLQPTNRVIWISNLKAIGTQLLNPLGAQIAASLALDTHLQGFVLILLDWFVPS